MNLGADGNVGSSFPLSISQGKQTEKRIRTENPIIIDDESGATK
jgi:hypothetical protein